jgi:hypothetical protein
MELTREEMENELILMVGWNEAMVRKATDSEIERWWSERVLNRGEITT